MTSAQSAEAGRAAARDTTQLALSDQGFDVRDGVLELTCSRQPCLTPGGRVEAQVDVRVVLPGIPGFVDGVIPLSVTVTASQVAIVDRFRAAAP